MARTGGKDRGLYQDRVTKRWYVRIAVHGVMKRFGQPTGFATKNSAKTFRDRLRTALLERRYFPDQQGSVQLLSSLVEEYLAGIHGKKTSYRDKKRHLTWWAARFPTRPILSLEARDIETALAALRKTSSPATANRYAQTLRAMMRKMVKPSSWVTELWERIELFPEPERVMPVYSSAQLDTLFARLSTDDACLVYLDLLLGLRESLLFSLRWEWLDWEQDVLQLPAFKRQPAFTLPLSHDARAIFAVLHQEHGCPKTGWVFPAPIQHTTRYNFTVHRNPHNWYLRTFKPILRELGMDLTFHALRRTWASMLGAHVPQRILQLLGNWQTGKVVERYCRPHDVHLRQGMEQVARSFGTARRVPRPKRRLSTRVHKLLKTRTRPRSSVG